MVAHDGSRASREALTLTCAELLLSADDVSHMLGARGTSEGSNAWPFFGACMRDNPFWFSLKQCSYILTLAETRQSSCFARSEKTITPV